MRILLLARASAATMVHSAGPAGPDATRLRTGEFLYSDLRNGKEVGHDRIVIGVLADGTYRFSNETSGAADQNWTAIATKFFAPVSVELTFGNGESEHKIFEIHYSGQRVKGIYSSLPAGTN